MFICPDCHHGLQENADACHHCQWKCQSEQQIPIYLSTHDAHDHLFQKYIHNYDKISVDDLENSIQDTAYLKSQNEKFYSYLPAMKGLKVCEVGIGKGMLIQQILKDKPAALVGVDISIPYLKYIQEKTQHQVQVVVGNAENLPFQEEFDVIIASDIIEHVLNVGDFLTSVNRALKPGGTFIVKTPNNEDINAYSKLRGCQYDFVHLRNFNKSSLKSVLIGAGFEIQKFIYDGFYPYRKRNYIKNTDYLNRKFDAYMEKKYPNVHEVNTIGNRWGCLIMNPIEITSITKKKYSILSKNE